MAFLSGTTLLGGEVADDIRGRVFAFVQTWHPGRADAHDLAVQRPRRRSAARRDLTSAFRTRFRPPGRCCSSPASSAPSPGSPRCARWTTSTACPFFADVLGSMRGPAAGHARDPRPRPRASSSSSRAARAPASPPRSSASPRRCGRRPRRRRHPRARRHRRPASASAAGARPRRRRVAGEVARPARRGAALRGRPGPPRRLRGPARAVRAAPWCSATGTSTRRWLIRAPGRTLPVDEVSWLSTWATGGLSRTWSSCSTSTRPSGWPGRPRGHADRLESRVARVPRARPACVPRSRRRRSEPLPGARRDPAGREPWPCGDAAAGPAPAARPRTTPSRRSSAGRGRTSPRRCDVR